MCTFIQTFLKCFYNNNISQNVKGKEKKKQPSPKMNVPSQTVFKSHQHSNYYFFSVLISFKFVFGIISAPVQENFSYICVLTNVHSQISFIKFYFIFKDKMIYNH